MSAEPLRVLVVDDNATLRRLVCLRLGVERDLEVIGEAGNGAVAVELAEALRPDVVLLDLSMPVMDGLEALPPLRERLPEAHLIVLSGFDQASLGSRVTELGADAYVEKGASLDELVEIIRRAGSSQVIDLTDQSASSERP